MNDNYNAVLNGTPLGITVQTGPDSKIMPFSSMFSTEMSAIAALCAICL